MESFFKALESIFDIFLYVVLGFFGFIVFLFLLAIIFGKRVEKKWEFEANFYNENKKEVGEFDIEMKRYVKENADFALEAKFRLKHSELVVGRVVQVFLEDKLVMEGTVEKEGRILLKNEHVKSEIENPHAGQVCRVLCSSVELFAEPIQHD
jgi:hypothetical protein